MDFRQIQLFLSAAMHQNFTTAAKECYIAQQGLSQQIIAMENEIGFSLFVRTGRNVELTGAGKVLFSELHVINTLYENALRKGRAAATGMLGTLSIGYATTVYNVFLINDTLSDFYITNPDVDVVIEEGDAKPIEVKLEQSLVDIIFAAKMHVSRIANKVDSISLGTSRIELAMSRDNPLASKEFITWSQLADETFIINKDFYENTENAFRLSGFTPKRVRIVPNHSTQVLAASSNMGVTLLPRSAGNLAIPELVFRPVEKLDDFIEVCAIWLKNNANPVLPIFINSLENRQQNHLLCSTKTG